MSREAAYAKDSCKIARFDGLPPKDWDKSPKETQAQTSQKKQSPEFQTTIKIK